MKLDDISIPEFQAAKMACPFMNGINMKNDDDYVSVKCVHNNCMAWLTDPKNSGCGHCLMIYGKFLEGI